MTIAKRVATLFLSFVLVAQGTIVAQESEPKKDSSKKDPDSAAKNKSDDDTAKKDDSKKSLSDVFADRLKEWKVLNQDIDVAISDLRVATKEKQDEDKKTYTELIEKADVLLPKLREAAVAAYREKPNEDKGVTRVLIGMAANDVRRDQFQSAYELAQLMIDNKCETEIIYVIGGIAAFGLNEFETAKEYLDNVGEDELATGFAGHATKNYHEVVDEYIDLWAKEQAIRTKEEKDELPRVELTTSQGKIVIELFENEAPQTVANFIHLVEEKFYDGLKFHRVLSGFMAQGGCPKGLGTDGPGYKIFCECYKEKYRNHFSGSLSMAHSGRDTGGSQFFITFRPTPHLNGMTEEAWKNQPPEKHRNGHTVFGRVVSGMDVLAKIKRCSPPRLDKDGEIEPDQNLPTPDTIVAAKVTRKKKDHEYKPTKVPGSERKDSDPEKEDKTDPKKDGSSDKKDSSKSDDNKSKEKKDKSP